MSATTITTTTQSFSDLDLFFSANPITGDVSQWLNVTAIKKSLTSLVLTKPYETPFHPEISCQASGQLFNLDSPTTQSIIKTSIIQTVTKFEPRVQLYDVIVNRTSAGTGYDIQIIFTIIGSSTQYSVSVMLTRTL